jgi:hypothetical protein
MKNVAQKPIIICGDVFYKCDDQYNVLILTCEGENVSKGN